MEPFSAGAVFASIGSAFKFVDIAVRFAEVGSQNEVFVRTVHVIREDLNEVNRLLSIESIREKLARIPGKLSWIRGAVTNTKTALNDIGEAIERVRVEKQATGSVQFGTRVQWVFHGHEKILNRINELTTCHQQLSSVLNYLAPLEEILPSVEPPAYHDATYFDDIISRHRGRTPLKPSERVSQNQKNLSLAEPPEAVLSECSTEIGTDTEHASASPSIQHTVPSDTSSSLRRNMPSSSPSLPSQASPPPCTARLNYTPAIQSSIVSSRRSFEHDQRSGVESRDQIRSDATSPHETTGACWSLTPQLRASRTEETKNCAYRLSQGDFLSPGAEGEFVGLTAANFQGPVDPFEFMPNPDHDLKRPVVALGSKIEGTKRWLELLEDHHCSVELPLNSCGDRDSEYGAKEIEARRGQIDPMVPSVPLPETLPQYHSSQPCSPMPAGGPLSRSRSAVDLNKQSKCSKPRDFATISRMRSQKQMMALLGSIET